MVGNRVGYLQRTQYAVANDGGECTPTVLRLHPRSSILTIGAEFSGLIRCEGARGNYTTAIEADTTTRISSAYVALKRLASPYDHNMAESLNL